VSAILIKRSEAKVYPNLGGLYFTAELESGKHSAIVVCRARGGLQVIVQNAANRCWKGMGKSFPTGEAALAAYKTPEIRAMISEALRLHQEAQLAAVAEIATHPAKQPRTEVQL
jgi:hypothetical protein